MTTDEHGGVDAQQLPPCSSVVINVHLCFGFSMHTWRIGDVTITKLDDA